MSQKEKILRLLEERGERGVHSFEFYEMRMPRGAAAIHALKKEGHPIEAQHETYKGESEGVRYFLRGNELVLDAGGPPAGNGGSSAFDPFGDFA